MPLVLVGKGDGKRLWPAVALAMSSSLYLATAAPKGMVPATSWVRMESKGPVGMAGVRFIAIFSFVPASPRRD